MITRWEHLTWEDIVRRKDTATAVIVTGSVEQHGKHLPLGTDTMIPVGLLDRLGAMHQNQPVKNLLLLPPVSFTPARHSNWLPGTVNLTGMTLISFMCDLLSDLFRQGIRRVLVFNGHSESTGFISEGISLAVERHLSATALLVNWWELVSDELIQEIFGDSWPGWEAEHAALTETSLMLALAPDLVKTEEATFSSGFKHYPYTIFPQPEEVRPPTGSYADMSAASAHIGNKVADHILGKLLTVLEQRFGKA